MAWTTVMKGAALMLLLQFARANQLDTIMSNYVAAKGCTCLAWTDTPSDISSTWVSASAIVKAGSSCAMPANASRSQNYEPWCVCKETGKATSCDSTPAVPEQINLQLAASDVVVVGFVTFEDSLPSSPPVACLSESEDMPPYSTANLSGVAHWYTTSHKDGTPRNYVMHFVRFTELKARQKYYYKVKSGAANGTWSSVFGFRAPYGASDPGPTRIAIYGDMGNTLYNNQGNLAADCESGVIDAILHMGDHCYNLGDTNDYRGDAYMNVYSAAALASCPWMPVIGNHESTQCPGDEVDESTHERYLNQTWGAAYGQRLSSTATTALGHLLTRGTLHGAGVHGSTPSGTSQWYSVNLGRIHLVGLDLDPKLQPNLAAAQLAWLEKDLRAANANRDSVPWIIVTSHFPIHNTEFENANVENASAAFYLGDEGHEKFATSGHDFVPCTEPIGKCFTVGQALRATASFLDPLLTKYHVDVYDAGHVHSYDSTWPLINGVPTQKSYVNPNGTVHITEGNGGVPGVKGQNTVSNCKSSFGRKCGTGGAYGRFIAHNASVLEYEHVENPTGRVTDSWAIVRT